MSDTPEVARPPVSDEEAVQHVSDMCDWHPDQVRRTLIASAYAERAEIVAGLRDLATRARNMEGFALPGTATCTALDALADRYERGEHHA